MCVYVSSGKLAQYFCDHAKKWKPAGSIPAVPFRHAAFKWFPPFCLVKVIVSIFCNFWIPSRFLRGIQFAVADLRGVHLGCKCTPLWRLVMYFCVHICTSPSNDYTAVACSNNNQAQLHTHISVPYWSPDVCLGLELLWDIQFRLSPILNNSLASYNNNYVCHKCIYVPEVGVATQNFSDALQPEPPFLNF